MLPPSSQLASLHRTVNDFTSLQRLRTGSFELKPSVTDLRTAIVRTAEAALPMARVPCSLWVQPATPTHAYLDALRLGQCIINACTNAAKHARLNVRVAVWCIGATAAAEDAVLDAEAALVQSQRRHGSASRRRSSSMSVSAPQPLHGTHVVQVVQPASAPSAAGGAGIASSGAAASAPSLVRVGSGSGSSEGSAGSASSAGTLESIGSGREGDLAQAVLSAAAAAEAPWAFDVFALPTDAWHDGKGPQLPFVLQSIARDELAPDSAIRRSVALGGLAPLTMQRDMLAVGGRPHAGSTEAPLSSTHPLRG